MLALSDKRADLYVNGVRATTRICSRALMLAWLRLRQLGGQPLHAFRG